jgi:hypothetical protein
MGPIYSNIRCPNRISAASRRELDWWRERLRKQPEERIAPAHTEIWHTDASQLGGAAVQLTTSSRQRTLALPWEKSHIHSNVREMTMAEEVALRARSGARIHLRMDNISSVATINKGGSTSSDNLNAIMKRIWRLKHLYKISLSASYVPGKNNLADDLSRRRKESPVESRETTDSRTYKRKASKHVPHHEMDCNPKDPLQTTIQLLQGLPKIQGRRIARLEEEGRPAANPNPNLTCVISTLDLTVKATRQTGFKATRQNRYGYRGQVNTSSLQQPRQVNNQSDIGKFQSAHQRLDLSTMSVQSLTLESGSV